MKPLHTASKAELTACTEKFGIVMRSDPCSQFAMLRMAPITQRLEQILIAASTPVVLWRTGVWWLRLADNITGKDGTDWLPHERRAGSSLSFVYLLD